MVDVLETKPLEDTLRRLVQVCEELSLTLDRERTALTSANTPGLLAALREKKEKLKEVSIAEEDRRRASAVLAQKLDLPPLTPLSRLAERLGKENSAPLAEIKDSLLSAMKKVSARNQTNARLIHRARGYTRQLWGLIADPSQRTYGPDGAAADSAPNLFRWNL